MNQDCSIGNLMEYIMPTKLKNTILMNHATCFASKSARPFYYNLINIINTEVKGKR